MKRNILILTCLLLAFLCVFTGCNGKASDVSDLEMQENQQSQSMQESQEVVEIPDPGMESDGKIDARLDSFEKNLKEAGMKLGERAFKDATALGAKEGYGLNINDIPVEVYLFDKNSGDAWTTENLKAAANSQTVTIFGVEINGKSPTLDCVLNGDLIVIFPMESMMPHPDKDKIVEIFNQL